MHDGFWHKARQFALLFGLIALLANYLQGLSPGNWLDGD